MSPHQASCIFLLTQTLITMVHLNMHMEPSIGEPAIYQGPHPLKKIDSPSLRIPQMLKSSSARQELQGSLPSHAGLIFWRSCQTTTVAVSQKCNSLVLFWRHCFVAESTPTSGSYKPLPLGTCKHFHAVLWALGRRALIKMSPILSELTRCESLYESPSTD